MATHTVYGCYNKATGEVEFDDTYSGCEDVTITGCLVLSGEHKGKIEITHDYDGCPTDEYFACYDPDTGKFEYDADDDCCEEWYSGYSCCGNDCDVYPRYIHVIISGVVNCGSDGTWSCSCEDANGEYILDWWEYDLEYRECRWNYSEEMVGCNPPYTVNLSVAMYISGHSPAKIRVRMGSHGCLYSDIVIEGEQECILCLGGSGTNYLNCDGSTFRYKSETGTALF